jgi:hypothetical protein
MAALSDYLENKVIDWLLRGQAFTPPATVYVGLVTAAENDAAGGTEVTGGSYARVAVASSLANWAGTQGAGTTVASSGTSGTTSNNGAITFPAPTANWGTIVGMAVFDAATGGNELFYAPLTTNKTVNNGDPAPSFAAAALSLQIDN